MRRVTLLDLKLGLFRPTPEEQAVLQRAVPALAQVARRLLKEEAVQRSLDQAATAKQDA